MKSESESRVYEHFFNRVYVHPELSHIKDVWNLIESIGRRMRSYWAIFGDFNEILGQSGKRGSRDRSAKQMKEFKEMLTACELKD